MSEEAGHNPAANSGAGWARSHLGSTSYCCAASWRAPTLHPPPPPPLARPLPSPQRRRRARRRRRRPGARRLLPWRLALAGPGQGGGAGCAGGAEPGGPAVPGGARGQLRADAGATACMHALRAELCKRALKVTRGGSGGGLSLTGATKEPLPMAGMETRTCRGMRGRAGAEHPGAASHLHKDIPECQELRALQARPRTLCLRSRRQEQAAGRRRAIAAHRLALDSRQSAPLLQRTSQACQASP